MCPWFRHGYLMFRLRTQRSRAGRKVVKFQAEALHQTVRPWCPEVRYPRLVQ